MKYKELRNLKPEDAKKVILGYLENDKFIKNIATQIVPNPFGTFDVVELTTSPEMCKSIVENRAEGSSFGSVYSDKYANYVAREIIKENVDIVSEWITSKHGPCKIRAAFTDNIGFYYVLENGMPKKHETNVAEVALLRDCSDVAGYGFTIIQMLAVPQ